MYNKTTKKTFLKKNSCEDFVKINCTKKASVKTFLKKGQCEDFVK